MSDMSNLSTMVPKKKSVIALECTLHQSINNLKEIVQDFEQLQIQSDDYKTQVLTLKEKCERLCVGSESLKKIIELKDNVIQSVASALTRLNETKDMKIIDEAFKILCGEITTLTPPNENADNTLMTPKKAVSPSLTESFNDQSVSEIEATPTGRKSPIILSRKARNAAASDSREKKKCPENWPTPETKAVKLTYPAMFTPQGKTGKRRTKMRQTRFTTIKTTSVIDITSSPEISSRNSRDSMKLNIKKESLDDEDTIEPSPTSFNSNFSSISAIRSSPLKLNKNSPNKVTKNSPAKLSLSKKPLSGVNKLQIKTEHTSKCNIENVENNVVPDFKIKMEQSINLLRPAPRFRTPEKLPMEKKDPDETECNIDSSLSLLQHVNKLEKVSPNEKNILCSPTEPLAVNINYSNLQKEPTVRKKSEKRALPGWSCDECKNFYAELYKDNPEMLAQKMDECSKHRGRQNPARPKTPPGFWFPRWDVPEDTEEFNRRNNAV